MKFRQCINFTLVLVCAECVFAGNGDGFSGDPSRPTLHERQLVSLVNECRMNPTQYRNYLLHRSDILLPANYPPVAPLRWNDDLGRAARSHCEDMAQNCGMQHTSSDGTSFSDRVAAFFSGSGWLAENISAGQSDPPDCMRSWLMDGSPTPAADKSSADGHRKNIMSGNYTQMGTGYAYGPQQYNRFWTQDFAGGTSALSTIPLVDGIHYDSSGTYVVFHANWFNVSGSAPTSATVQVENGSDLAMIALYGGDSAQTLRAVANVADGSRYRFHFSVGDESFLYPENGWLVTGPGIVYESTSAILDGKMHSTTAAISFDRSGKALSIPLPDGAETVSVFDCSGRMLLDKCGIEGSVQIGHLAEGVVLICIEGPFGAKVYREIIR